MTGTYQVYRLLWGSLDWLFPPVCAGCGKSGHRWCPECRQKVKPLPEPICEVCGVPIHTGGKCFSCSHSRPPYDVLRSWTAFEGPVRAALHSLKYRRNMALGEVLAYSLSQYVKNLQWPVDLVTAVPAGRKRLAERGYNQVSLIAWPLAESLKKPFVPKSLKRARETRSQVGLTSLQRRENVAGAFQGDLPLVSGRNILVMDDVATSGATLEACAQALRDAGASKVFALTLARALPHHGMQIV